MLFPGEITCLFPHQIREMLSATHLGLVSGFGQALNQRFPILERPTASARLQRSASKIPLFSSPAAGRLMRQEVCTSQALIQRIQLSLDIQAMTDKTLSGYLMARDRYTCICFRKLLQTTTFGMSAMQPMPLKRSRTCRFKMWFGMNITRRGAAATRRRWGFCLVSPHSDMHGT